ncbi:hypothetical protein [Gracilimonas halophila]|uniref:Uncharacterized protein n=1 Tax=Gracilimonas halophila TaxID=1834464 RepID=A0ABW5JH25_9BACT
MEFFRTHITRSFNVGILLTGFLFYFMKPVSDNTEHNAFASWLQSNLKSSTNTNVVDQIRGLSDEEGKLESVIRQASVLVKAHADDFELPVDTHTKDENEVFQLLLTEWNNYQNSSTGMGKAVIIKQAQPNSIIPVDGFSFGNKSLTSSHSTIFTSAGVTGEQIPEASHNFYISPLSGGTAINAP